MQADGFAARLDDRVAEARTAYAAEHPRSAAWSNRAHRVMPGGNTRSVLHFEPFPFRVERAAGCALWDVDGHRYVDLLGNYTAALLGHAPESVLTAARRALESGWSLGTTHANETLLAELIVERFHSISKVRFTNSGTEANLMAIALAVHHTGRRKVVVFRHGYHGGVLAFGDRPSPIDVPHDWLLCDYNDAPALEAAFDRYGDDIAAVLVEPMQGSAGCIPGDPDFLGACRDLTMRHQAVLIFDEVMTSRFSVGGAQRLLGLTPDLTTLGKYLAGGLTFGAFGGRDDLMSGFDQRRGGELTHAGTFNNNVASMAAGVVALSEIITADVLDELHRRGERLRRELDEVFAQVARDTGIGMGVTGVGSLMNVHGKRGTIASRADLADTDDRLVELFFFHALTGGFYLAPRGFIALSVAVCDADIDAFVEHARSFPAWLTST